MRYITIILLLISLLNAKDFKSFVYELKKEALKEKISKETIEKAFKNVKLLRVAIKADKNQPEKKLTFDTYSRKVVSKKRISNGVKKLKENQNLLTKVSKEFKVNPNVIVALWGIETLYGKVTGSFRVIDALATMAYEGRREKLFKKQLIYALKIIDKGYIEYKNMKGSWAGAMGQCQFMPSSFLAFAIDYDKDGKKDIWKSKKDIFASIANYLNTKGWRFNEPIFTKVELPKKFNKKLANLKKKKSLKKWEELGLKVNANIDKNLKASLFIPKESKSGYLVYENFFNLKKWNNSNHFALSVGLLAQKIEKEIQISV